MEKTPEDKAFDKACGFLSYRQRSEAEIKRYLEERGFSEEVRPVTERLKRVGLLDDTAFTASWISERSRGRGYGRVRLRGELLRFGVPKEIIDTALDELYPEEREDELARALGRKRWDSLKSLDPKLRAGRVQSFLMRKGFAASVAREAVTSLVDEDDAI